MSQILDINAASNILKQRYESDEVETEFVREHAVLADVPKDEKAGGQAFNIAVKFAPMSTRGVTVPLALGNGGPDQYAKFNIPELYSDYSVMQMSGLAADAAMGDENAMVKLASETLDGGFLAAYDSLANAMFGNGGGARAQLNGAAISGATVTLADAQTALRFWANQVIQFSSDDGTGGAGVRSGSLTVSGVDPIGGTVTFTTNVTAGIPSAGVSDYLFMNGDYNALFTGLAGWIPQPGYTFTAGVKFFGQDRSLNTVGLGGWRYAGNGAAYEDTLTQLAAMVTQYTGKPDRIYVSNLDFAQMAKQQSGKVFFDRASAPAFDHPEIQFEGLTFVHPKGKAMIVADAYCPTGHFYMLTMNTWKLYSMGKICRPDNNWVGQMWLPSYTDDVKQARLVTRAFLGCNNPGANGHGTF